LVYTHLSKNKKYETGFCSGNSIIVNADVNILVNALRKTLEPNWDYDEWKKRHHFPVDESWY